MRGATDKTDNNRGPCAVRRRRDGPATCTVHMDMDTGVVVHTQPTQQRAYLLRTVTLDASNIKVQSDCSRLVGLLLRGSGVASWLFVYDYCILFLGELRVVRSTGGTLDYLDIRAPRDFSTFTPAPVVAHFSTLARPAERGPALFTTHICLIKCIKPTHHASTTVEVATAVTSTCVIFNA